MSLALRGDQISPEPRLLPTPSPTEPRPILTLSELVSGRYVDTVARIASVRVSERVDQMGCKFVSTGVLEDRTFKLPFLCHKVSLPLTLNSIFKLKSVYVHEFKDKSLIVILTEYSRAEPREVEDFKDFLWVPKIGAIRRPVLDITLTGIIAAIYSSSGLVKRCNRCKKLVVDTCPEGCAEGWSWDLRISSKLYDGTGSIRTIFTRHLTAKVLQRSLGEILYLANTPKARTENCFETMSFKLRLPHDIDIVEGVVEDALSFRRTDKLLVPDGFTLLYFPKGLKMPSLPFNGTSEKRLDACNPDDSRILRKFVEKALDIKIREITGMSKVHDMYLLEEPSQIYSCELAKLYVGFSVKTAIGQDIADVESTPEAFLRENVWNYVKWRRTRGASANSIKHALLTQRSNVVLAPSNRYGHIEELIFKRAGDQKVSEHDSRSLVEFWKEVYDIDISPDEMPLLRVKPADSETLFTYPPSTLFYDGNVLFVSGRAQNFIASRKATLTPRVHAVMDKALRALNIGGKALELQEDGTGRADIQRVLLQETHQKLFGKTVKARGSIIQLGNQLYFFPNNVVVS